jgi:membrane fusion protein (multidrug efflux system)
MNDNPEPQRPAPSAQAPGQAQAAQSPPLPPSAPPSPQDLAAQRRTRTRWLVFAIAVFVLVGAGYTIFWSTVLRHRESTDDAYVNGNIVQITPQIAGTVTGIAVDDTQFVQAGQALVRLDQADARIALDQAEAQLAKTVREVRTLIATSAQLAAAVRVREADLATAQKDFARRERLVASGAISGEELQHAREGLRAAEAALSSARQQLAANQARVEGTTIAEHPDVRAAAAMLRGAFVAFERTVIPAPVAGYVARRSVQLGQRVSPGTPLMAVVPLDQVWVDANFKESQLARMQVGQPVKLYADVYGDSAPFRGTIAGIGAGTGSAFALLPAQNATGNWIKIVQRVPVRIALDPRELAKRPLKVGLSMRARVDLSNSRDEGGPALGRATPAYSTDAFGSVDALADARVDAILVANGAPPAAKSTRAADAQSAPVLGAAR